MNLIRMSSFGIVVIILFICKCNGQSSGMVAISDNKNLEDESHNQLKKLRSIEEVAKNISHSKGSIIKSKDGDLEYRRSFISKVELRVNSLQLQEIIAKIKNNLTEANLVTSVILDSLDSLESLVHQYDVGKEFIELGGFKLILSLTMNEDNNIAKAAFLVLSAALQGNKEVQKYALTTDLLKIIITTFYQHQTARINSALFTLSAFIRNYPDALKAFLLEKGVYSLSFLLENHFNVEKINLRIIDILGDISADLYDGNSKTDSTLLQLQKIFAAHIREHSLCDKITDLFYNSEKFAAHEKIVATLNSMFDTCKEIFRKKQLDSEVKQLIELYNPFKSVRTWYTPSIDNELRYYIFQDLKQLHKRIVSYEKTNIKFEIKHLKTEF